MINCDVSKITFLIRTTHMSPTVAKANLGYNNNFMRPYRSKKYCGLAAKCMCVWAGKNFGVCFF